MFSTWSNSWPWSREHHGKEWRACWQTQGKQGNTAGFESWLGVTVSTRRLGKIRNEWQCSLRDDDYIYTYRTLGSPVRRCSWAPQPTPTSSAVPAAEVACTLSCLDKVNRDPPRTMATLSFFPWMGRYRGRQQAGFRSLCCDYCWGLGVRVTLGSLDGRMCPRRKLPWVCVWCLLVYLFYFLLESRKRMSCLPGPLESWHLKDQRLTA